MFGQKGELYVCLDGGKAGNMTALSAPMKSKENNRNLVSKKFLLMYDEESLKLRRSRVKGVGVLRQVETLHVVTRGPLDVPTRKRLHFFSKSHKSEGIAF